MRGGAIQRTILIVDDDRGLLRLVEKSLRREGWIIAGVAAGREALAWLDQHQADLLLLDLKLDDMPGGEMVGHLTTDHPDLPFVIMTGQGDERVAVEMMKRGARDYLVKDAEFLEFLPEVVQRVLDQVETERRLAAAEERVNLVQNVVERGFSAVLIADGAVPDPRILYINPTFSLLTGYTPEQVIGQPLSALRELSAVRERLLQGVSQVVEEVYSYQTAEGERWGEWRLGPVRDRNDRVTHWLVILRDITERKRLEKEILEISDREQRRIGQDLHDGLCQQLAGIELMSQALEQKIAARSKADARLAAEIAGHVRGAIRQTRLLARGLSPVTLESEGVMPAFQELALNTEKMFQVACRFDCPAPVQVLDPSVATHLFRIAQEAVSNAIKHGKARRVTIQLRQEGATLVLSIRDDGTGFPQPLPRAEGMGLHIMQSRAGMIGGTLRTENDPRGGARVICRVALGTGAKPKRNASGRKTKTSEIRETDPHH
jgi:PAS domain S-box-containing protein